jgi:hypothetical protein
MKRTKGESEKDVHAYLMVQETVHDIGKSNLSR